MTASASGAAGSVRPLDAGRRDFLTLLAGAGAVIGAGAFAWPLIDSLSPRGVENGLIPTVDVDLSKLAPGQQMEVSWDGHPISVVRRSQATLLALQDPRLVRQLRDPDSLQRQQPDYLANWHRSIVAEYGVFVGLCTRCGCATRYTPPAGTSFNGAAAGAGGFACPCDGSRFDLAGRVFRDAPARFNLAVPPYLMRDKQVLRIGTSPDDLTFDFATVRRL